MKEIQGKIKFGVIDYNYIKKHGFTITDIPNKEDEIFILKNPNIPHWYISAITEEQAAEFVECNVISKARRKGVTQYGSYKQTAKESLISLLKANDVWIKEWIRKEFYPSQRESEQSMGFADESYAEMLRNRPDDLLLIKLT